MDIFEWTEQTPVTANNLNEMQNILNNNMTTNFQSKGTILWTNPSPSSSFEAQSITLSSSDYDMLEVYCAIDYNNTSDIVTAKAPKGKNIIIQGLRATAAVSPMRVRTCNYVSATSLSITTSYYGTTTLTDTSDIYLIPLYVVGYKTGLFN